MLVIISISVLQNFNYPSAFCVTIHVMIVRHNVRMQFRQWLYVLLESILQANRQHTMIIKCILTNAVLGLL